MARQDIFRGIEAWMYDLEVSPSILSEKEARAEYVRLAKIANKRIRRLQESQEFSAAKAAQKAAFGSVKEFKTERQLRAALQSVARFTASKQSSISGIRASQRKQLETMREMGYTFLNKGNIREFGEYMREVRKHAAVKDLRSISDRVVELFREAKRKNIDSKSLARNFEFWLEHEKELSDMKRSKETMSSEAAERLI